MNFNSYFTIKHTSNLRILLLTLFFIVPLGTIYGQNQLITIAGKNITLLKAFDAIESQTQLSITYSRTKIDVNRTLSVDFKKQKLSIVLDKLLAGTGFTYKIEKGYIVLVPVPVKQEQTEATSKKIQGVIVDTNGDPVIGASIQEKGVAGKGTVSDLDGKFNLSVASNAVLLISYIGFQSLEVKVGNRTSLSLVLKEDHQLLDEVVVIGYGTMEKRAVTSSITSISSKDLVTGLGGSTIATALKGKISGMNVSETSSPNASASFQLRGVASINASSSPLIVIDGIPGGDLRSISQEDIQSIDVLKDASAGAIYGTRAAGGVILVTTKKAKEGPITLSYTGELSTEQVSRRPQVLDRDAFVRFGVGTDLGASTDWYGELLNEGALSQRHVVTLSGGRHTARIYATIMAQDQKGIAIGDNRKDYSGRINANFNLLNDLLEIGLHTEYREAHRDQRSSSSCFDMALKMNPTEHVYDSTSETGYNVLVGGSEYYNPLAEVMLKQTDNVDKWLKADATVKLNLPAGFSAQATLGWEDRQYQQTHYVSALHRTSLNGSYKGKGFHGYSKTVNVSFEPTINFMRVFADDHTVSAVAGYSYWENNSENFDMSNYDFPVDGVGAWDMGTGSWLSDGKAAMSSHKYPRERLISFFGRANYSYKDRYMVTGSVRHEGSSKFGKNHRWGTFWAVGLGWDISKEKFMEASKIDQLKLRATYGHTGNGIDNAGYFSYLKRYNEDGGFWYSNGTSMSNGGSVSEISPLANTLLTWEKGRKVNVGLDLTLLKNRLTLSADYYNDYYYDILQSRGKSIELLGIAYPAENIGKTRYYGLETQLSWQDHIGKVNYYVSANWSMEQNKRLFMDEQYVPYDYLKMTGQPTGTIYGLVATGFLTAKDIADGYPVMNGFNNIQAGDVKYKDMNGDGEINEFDRTVIGGDKPTCYFGIDLGFEWKGLEVTALIQGAYNRDLYNSDRTLLEGFQVIGQSYGQAYTNLLNRWTPETAETATYPRLTAGGNMYNYGNNWNSSLFVQNGNYIRLKNATVSYKLPENFCRNYLGGLRVKIFVQGQNLLTWSRTRLQDPEVTFTSYPLQRTITTGINLNF